MFDDNQIIETKWTSHNREWYKQRGYKYTKINDILLIKAKDLTRASNEKIKITCDLCGKEFETPYSVYIKAVHKELCGTCSHKETGKIRIKNNAHSMIQKAKQVCEQNGYTLITTEDGYMGMSNKIDFICPYHGQQSMILSNLLAGHKCNKCASAENGIKCRLNKEIIIKKVESINGNKLLNPNEYIDVFTNNMIIQCSCGNTFTTSIQNYKKVNRCSICSGKESKSEKIIREYLELHDIIYEQEKRFDDCKDKLRLPFDFYLPKYNMCIEYDGEQHYWDVFSKESTALTKAHDAIKTKYCTDNNIRLIRIPYYEKNNIETILSGVLQVKDIV